MVNINCKIAQTMQYIWDFLVSKLNVQEFLVYIALFELFMQTSAIIQEISDSNLETGRQLCSWQLFETVRQFENWYVNESILSN